MNAIHQGFRVVGKLPARHAVTVLVREKHELPPLKYDYGALEPIISQEIMQLHHTKHHQTYVNNLNTLEGQLKDALDSQDVARFIRLKPGLLFNGGGHINHTIFWSNISPQGGGLPEQGGRFYDQINMAFGSFDQMKKMLTETTVGIQGSGWGWLAMSPRSKHLRIAKCPNQDPLGPTTGLIPLLGFDVWEHAYYLQYKNNRADYVNALWNIINWKDVEERYLRGLEESSDKE